MSSVAAQADRQRLQVCLVADGRTGKDADDVRALAGEAAHGLAAVAEDPDRVLATTYSATGLTAVLVRTDRIVRKVLRSLQPGRDLAADLRALETPTEIGRSPVPRVRLRRGHRYASLWRSHAPPKALVPPKERTTP